MNDLDPTGYRANLRDPKLTTKAWWRERGDNLVDAFWAVVRFFVALWGFMLENLLFALLLGVVVAATSFDWYMSARGWRDILPGVGFFANLGALASVGAWYYGLHKALEAMRAKDKNAAITRFAVAGAGFLICVIGVLVATATNSVEAQGKAKAARTAHITLQNKRDALAAELETYSVEYWETTLASDEARLEGQIGVARARFGMPDLDIKGACSGVFDKTKPADVTELDFKQERACAYANGGIDPNNGKEVQGTRFKIVQDQQGLKKAKANVETLKAYDDELDAYVEVQGDQTAEAIDQLLGKWADGNAVLLGLFVLISALFLFAGGFMGDWLWEQVQTKMAQAKALREKL